MWIGKRAWSEKDKAEFLEGKISEMLQVNLSRVGINETFQCAVIEVSQKGEFPLTLVSEVLEKVVRKALIQMNEDLLKKDLPGPNC